MATSVINYEGKRVSPEQIQAFRNVLESCWIETLNLPGGIRQWNKNLLAITENRRTINNPDGSTKVFYSWCGDWVTYHLEQAGCRHGLALNRQSLNGKWLPGLNLTLLRAWAGESAALNARPALKQRFKGDVSSGAMRGGPKSFHVWDNKRDVCKDGYEPSLGDLIICPRKNGDHIEFWVKQKGDLVTVSAGAQVGGVAQQRERDMNVSSFLGIIDISGLVTSEPF